MSTESPPQVNDTESTHLRRSLNVPNAITLSRLLLAAGLFWIIDEGVHWEAATWLFLVAASTDFVDGYIARKYGLVTVLGRIMDPFVDKIIICGAFVFLMEYRESGVGPWIVTIVIGREMFVTSLRSFLEQRGKDFSASLSGKLKMVIQCAAVVACLLTLGADEASRQTLDPIKTAILWSAVGVTVWSGMIYVVRAMRILSHPQA